MQNWAPTAVAVQKARVVGKEASIEILEPVPASTQSGKEYRIATGCWIPKFPGLDRWLGYWSYCAPSRFCLV
jgi:hypothetical protein